MRPEALLLVTLGSFMLTGLFILYKVNSSTSPIIFQLISLNIGSLVPLSGFMVQQFFRIAHFHIYCIVIELQ